MGTKLNVGKFNCYAHALPDEPMFVLLARDPDMPDLVREWANRRQLAINAGHRPQSDQAMVDEARDCASHARSWRKDNDGKWRSPSTAKDREIAALREALGVTLAWTKEYREDYANIPAERDRVDLAIAQARAALEMSGGVK